MVFDIKTQAIVSLAIQVLLIMTVSCAVFLAKKRNLGKHCVVMRVAVLLQIIAIASVMLPSMLGYIENEQRSLSIEMLMHHSLGLIVIAIWIYINLVFAGAMRMRGSLAAAMRLALVSWILALIIGLHMYSLIWM